MDKEGTAGINTEMEQAKEVSKASILPNHLSLVVLLVETCGGYLAYRRNPQERAYPSQNFVLHLPFQLMQSATHTGVPRDHCFDQKVVWWECNPAAPLSICTAETPQCSLKPLLSSTFFQRSQAFSSFSWCNSEPSHGHGRLRFTQLPPMTHGSLAAKGIGMTCPGHQGSLQTRASNVPLCTQPQLPQSTRNKVLEDIREKPLSTPPAMKSPQSLLCPSESLDAVQWCASCDMQCR